MFKKKVLSSLLAMSMVFSTGSFAGAEEIHMSPKNCKKICNFVKNKEKQAIKRIEVIDKEIKRSLKYRTELLREKFDTLIKFIEKTNFKEDVELGALYDFYFTQETENFRLLEKSAAAQENYTRALWQEYKERCPKISCKGVYGGVDNSVLRDLKNAFKIIKDHQYVGIFRQVMRMFLGIPMDRNLIEENRED
mgnify:FL=1